jgi:hypothetical protein
MPCDWRSLFDNLSGTALLKRRFHRPTNLEPTDQVWLVCAGVRGNGTILLNDQSLREFSADGESVECELTGKLHPFNIVSVRLSVTIEPEDARPAGLFEPVALEIRSV